MTFDPDAELETQDDHDAYVRWCADRLVTAADEGDGMEPRIYATAMRAAAWLWVVAQAQMHLADDVKNPEPHRENLGTLFLRARAVERAQGEIEFRDLLTARIALDCFEPAGRYGATLLSAAKVAIEALELIFIYPPIDKWDLPCPGAWALILCGAVMLEEIADPTTDDYAVRPSPGMVGKITWDAAHRVAARIGAPRPSRN